MLKKHGIPVQNEGHDGRPLNVPVTRCRQTLPSSAAGVRRRHARGRGAVGPLLARRARPQTPELWLELWAACSGFASVRPAVEGIGCTRAATRTHGEENRCLARFKTGSSRKLICGSATEKASCPVDRTPAPILQLASCRLGCSPSAVWSFGMAWQCYSSKRRHHLTLFS